MTDRVPNDDDTFIFVFVFTKHTNATGNQISVSNAKLYFGSIA